MAQVNIKDASHGLHPHSYNPLTVASLDYGELLCSRFIECEKSDDWKQVQANGYLRLAALDFPAYGRSYIKSAAFFVPFYQLLQNYDGIRSDMLVDKGQSCVVPRISSRAINAILLRDIDREYWASEVWSGSILQNLPDYDDYDCFAISSLNGVTKFHALKLNYRGRRFYKFMKMLGYDFGCYSSADSYDTQLSEDFPVDALNLLAYAKVYTDYFLNVHLYNSSPLVHLLHAIKDGHDYVSNGGNTYYDSSTGLISLDCVVAIFNWIQMPFESNLYLNAWNNENSPAGINNLQNPHPENIISPQLPTVANSGNYGTTDDIYNSLNVLGLISRIDLPGTSPTGHPNVSVITQLGLNSLAAVFDFVRRNNLFGSEAAKQAFARFGIKGDDYNTYFARKLFEDSQEIDFSAVMSNSNTVNGNNGSVLGAYAGVGLGSMNFDYNYKCSDYGLILNLNWIQFNMLQMHGFDPSVLRFHAFDWYNPKFDGKAQRAVPMMEIGIGKKPLNANHNQDKQIFGFIGIYDEYRHMRDVVLGDFCVGFAKNFVFGRDLSYLRTNASGRIAPQTSSVQYYNRFGQDAELTDPFQFSNTNGDRFYLQFIWKIDAERPMLSDADSLMLDGAGDIPLSTDGNPNA